MPRNHRLFLGQHEKESQGRYIFYGMMITEAVIAMIWAAAAMSLLDGQTLNEYIKTGTPSAVVNEVSMTLLGAVGGTIAVLGAVVLPITSGDTAFRAARSIIADYLKIDQHKIVKRLTDCYSIVCNIGYVNTN